MKFCDTDCNQMYGVLCHVFNALQVRPRVMGLGVAGLLGLR